MSLVGFLARGRESQLPVELSLIVRLSDSCPFVHLSTPLKRGGGWTDLVRRVDKGGQRWTSSSRSCLVERPLVAAFVDEVAGLQQVGQCAVERGGGHLCDVAQLGLARPGVDKMVDKGGQKSL